MKTRLNSTQNREIFELASIDLDIAKAKKFLDDAEYLMHLAQCKISDADRMSRKPRQIYELQLEIRKIRKSL